MVLVDTCGWLEYFTEGPLAQSYAPFLEKNRQELLVPVIVVYEVYKFLKRETDEELALAAIAQLENCKIAFLDSSLAMEAADISAEHRLAMADAIVYATARHYQAELISSDGDFEHLPDVRFITKHA